MVQATMATRKNQVQASGRRRDAESYLEDRTVEKARKARREFGARVGALPGGRIVQRPVVKKGRFAGQPVKRERGVDGGGDPPSSWDNDEEQMQTVQVIAWRLRCYKTSQRNPCAKSLSCMVRSTPGCPQEA